jgi:hypothetical protein
LPSRVVVDTVWADWQENIRERSTALVILLEPVQVYEGTPGILIGLKQDAGPKTAETKGRFADIIAGYARKVQALHILLPGQPRGALAVFGESQTPNREGAWPGDPDWEVTSRDRDPSDDEPASLSVSVTEPDVRGNLVGVWRSANPPRSPNR